MTEEHDADGRRREAMRRAYETIDATREMVDTHLRTLLAKDAVWSSILASIDAETMARQQEQSIAVQRAALLEDNWEPLLLNLSAQGAFYASMGVTFDQWYPLLTPFREKLIPWLLEGATDLREAAETVTVIDEYVDISMANIAKAYLETKETRIRQQKARLDLALESAGVSTWEYDPASETLNWDERAHELFDVSSDTLARSLEAFLGLIHPGDREGIREWFQVQLVGSVRTTGRLRIGERTFRLFGSRQEGDGQTQLTGLVLDVTEAVALAQRNIDLARFLEISPSATLQWRGDEVVFANPSGRKLVGDGALPAPVRRVVDACRLSKKPETRDVALGEYTYHIVGVASPSDDSVFLNCIDITSRLQAEAARAEAEAMSEANRVKSQFLANMSHEIRTPLNAVIGMADLLVRSDLRKSEQHQVEIIQASAAHLLSVIDNILDYSRIDAEGIELEQMLFNLEHTVEDVVAVVAAKGIPKDVELSCFIEPAAERSLIGDVTRVKQVLLNLVANAMKFTRAGEVHVRAATAKCSSDTVVVELCVRDTGPGISAEAQTRLFQPFSQADASVTRKHGGSGLGLAISKRLAEAMGGELALTSELGRGSTFTFRFVAKRTADAIERTSPLDHGWASGLRLLLVDDNATNRLVLETQARAWGMHVRATGEPLEALGWARDGDPFDLALLDHQMPIMSGIELARLLQGLRPSLPMILLSSDATPMQARQSGVRFAACLNKPIRQSRLYDEIAVALGHLVNAAIKSSVPEQVANSLRMRVLVAEDNPANQQVIQMMLDVLGCTHKTVEDGAQTLAVLQDEQFDVILLDVQMPVLDGMQVARVLNAQKRVHERPYIIGLTAQALEGDRERCLEAGMDDYVSKPIVLDRVAAALKRGATRNEQLHGRRERAHQPKSVRPGVIDRATLTSVLQQMGRDRIEPLVDILRRVSPAHVQSLRLAAQAGDRESAIRHAHILKGSPFGFVGADAIGSLCADAEQAAQRGDLAALVELAEKIQQQLTRALEEMTEVLEHL